MRNVFCILAVGLFLCGWKAETLPSLSEFSKPYLGMYVLEECRLGEINLLDEFAFVGIELKSGGEYLYIGTDTDGTTLREEGHYTFDEASGTLRLDGFSCRCEHGEIFVGKQFGDAYFFARFAAQ